MRQFVCSKEARNFKEILEVPCGLDLEVMARSMGYQLRRRKLSLSDQIALWANCLWGGGGDSLATLIARRRQSNPSLPRVSEQALSQLDCRRPWELFADLFAELVKKADPDESGRSFKGMAVNVLDASVIKGLAPQVARFFPLVSNKGKVLARIKTHVLLDLASGPREIKVTDANNNDGQHKDFIWKAVRPNMLLIFDLGYWDFAFLDGIQQRRARFVMRVFPTNRPQVLEVFSWNDQLRDYKAKLNRYAGHPKRYAVRVIEQRQPDGSWWRWCTNLMDARRFPAGEIVELYRMRWEVEVFFRVLKQTLGLKRVRSRNRNAVLTEIYMAFIAYLLVHWLVEEAARDYPVEPPRQYCMLRAARLLEAVSGKLKWKAAQLTQMIAEHCTIVLSKERLKRLAPSLAA